MSDYHLIILISCKVSISVIGRLSFDVLRDVFYEINFRARSINLILALLKHIKKVQSLASCLQPSTAHLSFHRNRSLKSLVQAKVSRLVITEANERWKITYWLEQLHEFMVWKIYQRFTDNLRLRKVMSKNVAQHFNL